MTISLANSTPIEYAGNGTSVTFFFPWKIFASTDLLVGFITGGNYFLQDPSTYSVAGVGINGGGSVTFNTAPPLNTTVDLRTEVPETQPTEFANSSSYLPENTTNACDRLTRSVQDLTRLTYTFGFHGPDTEIVPWTEFPSASARANTIPVFDANGLPTIAVSLGTNLFTQANFNFFQTQSPPYLPIPAESGVNIVNPQYLPYDIRRYGADSTGVIPSDTALASAITVCGTTGGTIRFPNGVYSFANPLNLNSKIALIFQGDGSAEGGAQPGTQLIYTGTGSSWVTMAAASGCWFRDMQMYSNNAAFSGAYITCGAIASQPSNFCGLSNVVIGDTLGTGNVHLALDQTIVFTAQNCNFIGGNPSVTGAGAASYSNVIRFRDCHWVQSYSSSVQVGGQAWLFSGCTFEALQSGAPGGLVSPVGTQIVGSVVEACWFGDATATVGAWLDIRGQNMSFTGNYVSGNQTGSTGITLEGFHGAVIQGNTFAALLNGINCAIPACDQTVLTGNVFNSVTNPVAGSAANSTPGTWVVGANFGLTLPAGQGVAGTNGYVAEGNGIVRQWGHATNLANGNNTITFTTPFPNSCFNVVVNLNGVLATTAICFVGTLTAINFVLNVQDSGATVDTAYWQAIGR